MTDHIHFMTSRSNSLSVKESKQPWVNMFKGNRLSPEWTKLMKEYPDRFVLAFDNVWPEDWSDFYLKQVRLWHTALSQLPENVAHAIAHENAERLWKLDPLR